MTVVAQDPAEMGRTAAQALFSRIEGQGGAPREYSDPDDAHPARVGGEDAPRIPPRPPDLHLAVANGVDSAPGAGSSLGRSQREETVMVTEWTQPGVMTDPGKYAGLLDELPADAAGVARVAQGLLIHEFWTGRTA